MTDEGDSGPGRMGLQRGNDSVDARASKCWLERGRDVREGARGDLGGHPGAGKRARQQHVWSASDPGEPSGGHAELGLALGSERTFVVGNAGRPSGHRGSVADEQELHRSASGRGEDGEAPRAVPAVWSHRVGASRSQRFA